MSCSCAAEVGDAVAQAISAPPPEALRRSHTGFEKSHTCYVYMHIAATEDTVLTIVRTVSFWPDHGFLLLEETFHGAAEDS